MRHQTRPLIAAFCAATLFLSTSGCCTLIGVGVGAIVDSEKEHGLVPPERWDHLKPGRKVEVTRTDGSLTIERAGPDSTLQPIPREEIASVVIPRGHSATLTGGMIGFMTDAAILAITVVTLSQIEDMGGGAMDR